MSFISAAVGWISGGPSVFGGGGDGFIRKTSDGGATWTAQFTVTNQPVMNVFMANSSVGYAMADAYSQSFLSVVPGFILEPVKCGGSWTATNSPPAPLC